MKIGVAKGKLATVSKIGVGFGGGDGYYSYEPILPEHGVQVRFSSKSHHGYTYHVKDLERA